MAKIELPRAAYDELRKAERELHDFLPELDKAESCGIECEDRRQRLALVQQGISEVIKQYFTPPPT